MKIEQQVCSLDLAKRLKELEVKQISLFFYDMQNSRPEIRMEGEAIDTKDGDYAHIDRDDISAFTVGELGEMLPYEIKDKQGTFLGFSMLFARFDNSEEQRWGLGYGHGVPDGGDELSRFKGREISAYANTEADARAKMMIYLLENNLISSHV